ncbi:unnamed protein product [Polarella glacialis]|uniref:Uncharacterized protein n=1 Tax=Polarella glacialis TaxID=89957 RepID=A0A813LRB8_POLGL|nr:unnamed protein product [Polarella glacialis]
MQQHHHHHNHGFRDIVGMGLWYQIWRASNTWEMRLELRGVILKWRTGLLYLAVQESRILLFNLFKQVSVWFQCLMICHEMMQASTRSQADRRDMPHLSSSNNINNNINKNNSNNIYHGSAIMPVHHQQQQHYV